MQRLTSDTPSSKDLIESWERPRGVRAPRVPTDFWRTPGGQWSYYWLPLGALDGYTLRIGDDTYVCTVLHKPKNCNYWHFELHFCDQNGLDTDKLLPKGKRDRVAKELRKSLVQLARTETPTLAGWPEGILVLLGQSDG